MIMKKKERKKEMYAFKLTLLNSFGSFTIIVRA